MFDFGECVQNPPPKPPQKKTWLEPIERSCHSFTQMILPGILQEKILKSKKSLGPLVVVGNCSSLSNSGHTPIIRLKFYMGTKNTIFQRSHLFQTIGKHRDASLAPQLKKLNSISTFLGKPHPNHTTLSHHGCGKLPIWRLNSSSKSLFSTSIN